MCKNSFIFTGFVPSVAHCYGSLEIHFMVFAIKLAADLQGRTGILLIFDRFSKMVQLLPVAV